MSTTEMVNDLLKSEISSYQIAKDTGVHVSSSVETRKGKRKVENLQLKTAEKLTNYYHALIDGDYDLIE